MGIKFVTIASACSATKAIAKGAKVVLTYVATKS
jgi:hypothetical protein